ncbi:hypothetical protein BC831DRAFT_6090 [Entophlyctis helioformis]|nr:hypothetical protein BC831DRAFT_6090 [Entophlyctis helioformis]
MCGQQIRRRCRRRARWSRCWCWSKRRCCMRFQRRCQLRIGQRRSPRRLRDCRRTRRIRRLWADNDWRRCDGRHDALVRLLVRLMVMMAGMRVPGKERRRSRLVVHVCMASATARQPLWVRSREQLRRRLSKVVDLVLNRPPLHRILDAVERYGTFVGQIVKHIVCLDRCFARLLVSPDEIHPRVQMVRHVVALECLALDPDKLFC